MATISNPLQVAIYNKLTGDSTLMSLVTNRIYDHVPQGAAFPYLAIGDDTLTDWSTFARLGQQATVTLHAWSREKGRKEVKAILSQVDTVLNRQELTLSGFTFVACVREFEETFLDADGITYHGVQRYRVMAHA